MGNAREWAIELENQWEATEGNLVQVVIETATEALALLKEHSPVGNPLLWKHPVAGYIGGQFRANWVLSVGQPSGVSVAFPGGDLTDDSFGAISNYPKDGTFPVIYISNNLPYALPLENGHSTQAPLGIVAITVPELEAFIGGLEI